MQYNTNANAIDDALHAIDLDRFEHGHDRFDYLNDAYDVAERRGSVSGRKVA